MPSTASSPHSSTRVWPFRTQEFFKQGFREKWPVSRTESDSFEFPKIYKENGVEKSVGGVKYKSKRACWRQAEL